MRRINTLTLAIVAVGVASLVAFAQPPGEQKEPSTRFITNSIGMKLALVPAGVFLMGAQESDADAEAHERPRHKVRITRPFYLGTHEVTVGRFRKFVEQTGFRTAAETDGKGSSGYSADLRGFEYGKRGYTWKNVGWEQGDHHPVLNVTWDDAVAFCRWLSKKESKTYRLPTEAEWEYACRAGTATRFYSGDALEDTKGAANALDQSLIAKWAAAARDLRVGKPHKYNVPVPWDDGHPFTAPVGKFKPNAWGLYDMHGNAAEWCADWYGKDYYRDSPAADPAGPAKGTARVVRGGTFLSSPKVSRASMRVASFPAYRNYVIGFRVVLETTGSGRGK
jgi:formylglycine-generating enzyme required for sulfatase activity